MNSEIKQNGMTSCESVVEKETASRLKLYKSLIVMSVLWEVKIRITTTWREPGCHNRHLVIQSINRTRIHTTHTFHTSTRKSKSVHRSCASKIMAKDQNSERDKVTKKQSPDFNTHDNFSTLLSTSSAIPQNP